MSHDVWICTVYNQAVYIYHNTLFNQNSCCEEVNKISEQQFDVHIQIRKLTKAPVSEL